MAKKTRLQVRQRRRKAIRKNVSGTADRPRLAVFRSLKHIYAQVVNDETATTYCTASTLTPEIREQAVKANKKDAAGLVGKLIADRCKENGIEKVVFDRGGFVYHGRVAALADAARKAGLKF